MSECTKTSWPELLGIPAEMAKQKILNDCPNLKVHLVPEGSMVTTDFDLNRVRVFFNKDGLVSKVPQTG